MNIGINTLFYLPGQVGGTETYLLEILRGFEALGSQHTFTLFTQIENDELLRQTFRSSQWKFETLHFRATNRVQRILREQTELPLRARRARVNVLWSPGYTQPLLAPCPTVVTVHDMQYKSFPEDLSLTARWTTNALVQTAALKSDAIIAVSSFSRNEILKHTAAKPERVHVILEAAAPEFERNLSEEVQTPQRPFILGVSNSYPHKRVDKAILAFAEIEDHVPHDLVWVGRADRGEPEVERVLGHLKDPSRFVRRTGVDRSLLCQLYQQADLFVFPSEYEGFGLPVLEALLAGTRVLTTQCGSLPEVGGNVVTYFDHRDPHDLSEQMLRMLQIDRGSDDSARVRRQSHAKTFSWHRAAKETLTVLERAAKSNAPMA